ncbi:hypothetical protein RHGRI_027966 [Rhododendron griersonianum]|uniref:NAC domain-containing protein n=1 Tax=Rhododendron griersonianum TaxID=479676 RepID=A0AAV6IYU3_9ERIC|nr:hypothetical protein RHGRI_027966 [Rhododendron griersonianum]
MAVLPLSSLPVGYRFRPTDEELVNHFLKNKINGKEDEVSGIREVDLCKMEPWDLPVMSLIETNDDEWIFFCPIDRKYRMGPRSNRATAGGYWKATGKDRFIKAVRRTTVIGTKKTLVFYTGRAPIGQKTNWVIHEYRATSKELDGTKPGQGSFVLCKLMKKCNKNLDGTQDENIEGSNFEEFEQNDASPATVQSFSVDRESEPAAPIISGQDGKLPSSGESSILQRFDGTPLVAPLPTEWTNNGNIANDVADISIVEPDFDLDDMLRELFPDTNMEPPDAHGVIFPPLHSQVQVELGSSNDLQYPLDIEVGNDQRGAQLLHGTNEDEINQFLESLIVSTDEYFCDDPESYAVESEISTHINHFESTSIMNNVSCIELDAEVANAQNNESKAPLLVEMYSRGYKTTDISNEENLRSLGLLENESLGRHCVTVASTSDQSVDLFNSPEADRNNSNAVGGGEDFGTGIRLRSRQSYNQPNAEFFELQGNARRRIRLQQKLQVEPVHSSKWGHLGYNEGNHEANYILAKVGEAEEKYSDSVDETREISLSTANYVTEVAQEQGSNTISASVFPISGEKEVSSVPLEAAPPLHLILSSMHMLRVLVVVGDNELLKAYLQNYFLSAANIQVWRHLWWDISG